MRRSIVLSTPPAPGSRIILGGLAVGILALAAFLPVLAPRPAKGVDPAASATLPEHTISVSGTGTVVISPDTAEVHLGVQVQKPTVKEVRTTAAAAMTKVLAALHADGILDRDIVTSIISLQPAYDYTVSGAPPRITGYQFSNEITVTVHNLDRLGPVVDDSLAAGATTVNGISFRLADPSSAEQQARNAAMADAKSSANALAAAAGVTIVGVSQVTETSSPGPTPQPYLATDKAASGAVLATPIQPGTTNVVVTVAVVYRIG